MKLSEFRLSVRPGLGLVARLPTSVLVVTAADWADRPTVERLLDECRQVAVAPLPDRLAAVVEEAGPEKVPSFCALADDGDGLALFVHGDSQVVITGAQPVMRLSGRGRAGWTSGIHDRVASVLVTPAGGAPEPAAADEYGDLRDGVVPGGAIVLWPRDQTPPVTVDRAGDRPRSLWMPPPTTPAGMPPAPVAGMRPAAVAGVAPPAVPAGVPPAVVAGVAPPPVAAGVVPPAVPAGVVPPPAEADQPPPAETVIRPAPGYASGPPLAEADQPPPVEPDQPPPRAATQSYQYPVETAYGTAAPAGVFAPPPASAPPVSAPPVSAPPASAPPASVPGTVPIPMAAPPPVAAPPSTPSSAAPAFSPPPAASPPPGTPMTAAVASTAPVAPVAPVAPAPAVAPVAPASAVAPVAPEAVAAGDTVPAAAVDGAPVMVWGVHCKKGHFNNPEARYCHMCGTHMVHQRKDPVLGPRPVLGFLVLDDGSTFKLDADYVIGRQPEADNSVRGGAARALRMSDPQDTVSPVHAAIKLQDWDVFVTDLGSKYGTHVWKPGTDGWVRLDPGQRVKLEPRTHLVFGRRTLIYDSVHRS